MVFGVVTTAVWITAGLVYLVAVVGWNNFVTLPTATNKTGFPLSGKAI